MNKTVQQRLDDKIARIIKHAINMGSIFVDTSQIMYNKEQSRKEYIRRINMVIDHLEQNIGEPHNLGSISEVASFSPFHFHRIFKALTGETLNTYVKRIRLQRAGSLLLNDPEIHVSEVAVCCGFNSTEVFCRAFKQHFQKSASEFRKYWLDEKGKNYQSLSKIHQSGMQISNYISDEFINKNRNVMMEKNVQVKDLPALDLAYVRHTGAFDEIKNAYGKLMSWAGPRGLLNFPKTHTVTVYHDDPKVTDPAKVRQSACITVEGEVKTEGEVGKMHVPGGKYAVGHFDIHVSEFDQAWDAMCTWFSESGYQPSDGYPYEYYYDHSEDVNGPRFEFDICIPVKSL